MHRRDAIAAIVTGLSAPFVACAGRFYSKPVPAPDFASLERQLRGRVGVSVLDVASRRQLTYRADERFPLCSTFKWLLAAHVLSRVDHGREELTRFIPYAQGNLLEHAPITRAQVTSGGMTISALLGAAIRYSDNTAANLLLRSVGGPSALTAYLRSIGDAITRMDRVEPELNNAVPGDVRDTTTPRAMVGALNALLVQDRLSVSSRALLLSWLEGNTTGAEKLRAGLPGGWRVGDKTGAGGYGTTNDVAIIWPSADRPLLVAAYLTETTASLAARNQALAAIGHAVAMWVQAAYVPRAAKARVV